MVAFDARSLSRNLIGNMDIRRFDTDIRERRFARFAGVMGADALDRLCSLSTIESLLAREAIPLPQIDIFDHGHLRRLADMQRKSGRTGLAVVADAFRAGATIRVRDLDRFDPRLTDFADEIRRYFAAHSQINVYLTPPGTSGFPPHFDITDVFIVQCLGTKQWQVFGDYTNRIELPPPETNWEPDRFVPSGPADDVTLDTGDVLYLPRGVMHRAFCTDRESMHLTISLTPLTVADLLAQAVRTMAAVDVDLRRRVAWSVDGSADDLEEVNRQIRQSRRAIRGSAGRGAADRGRAPLVPEQRAGRIERRAPCGRRGADRRPAKRPVDRSAPRGCRVIRADGGTERRSHRRSAHQPPADGPSRRT